MKKVWILKIVTKMLARKNFNQTRTIQQRSSISNGNNNNTLSLKILTYFELY